MTENDLLSQRVGALGKSVNRMRARRPVHKVLLFLFAMLAITGHLVPQAPAKPRDRAFYDSSYDDARKPPGTLLRANPMAVPGNYRARAWRILYSTRDFQGHPLLGSGFVIIPTVPQRQPGPRKIVAWAHPTVGTVSSCAPSLRSQAYTSILGINDLVSLGYVVVAPDYPGLGTEGPIGYLVGKGQAYAVLDAVRAMTQISGNGAGRDLAIFGYSQGAHAALFSAAVARSYAPEFALRGVAAIGAPTDLRTLLARNADTLEGRILLAFTLQSWAVKYGLSMRAVVADSALPGILAVNRYCIDTLKGKVKVLDAQKMLGGRLLQADPASVPGWSAAMAENSLTVLPKAAPYLIMQGGADSIVRKGVTLTTFRNSCRAGANIRYVTLPGSSHGNSAVAGASTAINWISARFRGEANENSCR